jgi:hypothetical protein
MIVGVILSLPTEAYSQQCPDYGEVVQAVLNQSNDLARASGLGGNHNPVWFYTGAAGLPGYLSTRIGQGYVNLLNAALAERAAMCRNAR